jgi:hypothetical protein
MKQQLPSSVVAGGVDRQLVAIHPMLRANFNDGK